MTRTIRRSLGVLAAGMLPLAATLAGEAAPQPSRSSAGQAGPAPAATLKELMGSTVDPAADAIWDSVAVVATRSGVEHREPHNAEEWAALRRQAITLIEACNLIALPGRHAAPEGTQPGLGELDPRQIEQKMARQRAVFVSFAKALQVTAQQTLEAIDRRDTAGVMTAGGHIDEACEACHVVFWYPKTP